MKMENGSIWNRIISFRLFNPYKKERNIKYKAKKWKRNFHKAYETHITLCFSLILSLCVCDLSTIP